MTKSHLEKERGAETPKPSHEEIARLAYNLFLDRGRQPGHEAEDWYAAEELLIGQINLETASRQAQQGQPQSRR